MSFEPSPYYHQLKRRLWIGTAVVNLIMAGACALFWPQHLKLLVLGMMMGVFYLWSLSFNAEHPKKGVQFVFSLIRICILAYVIVKLSNARVTELGIVICGLLSYKVILTVEYVVQASQAFRISAKRMPFSPKSIQER